MKDRLPVELKLLTQTSKTSLVVEAMQTINTKVSLHTPDFY